MKTALTWLMMGALVVGIVGVVASPAAAVTVYQIKPHGMTPVSFAALPGPVRTTMLNMAGGNTITDIQKGMRGSRIVYGAQWTTAGYTVKILVANSGSLLTKSTINDNP